MASAKETETSISKLRELGFSPAAPPGDAVAKLASLRGNADDLAIARALGELVAPEAAAMLAEMEVGTRGVLRREIRRSLFRLRQHGIQPPASLQARPTAAAVEVADVGLSGLMSPADAEGARIVWLLKARTGGGLKRLWAIASEKNGLLAVSAESISRKELRSDRAEIERRAGAALVDADWRLVDFIMCEAYRRTPEAQRPQVGTFLTLRTEMIASSPAAEFHHPVYDEFAVEVEREPSPDLMKEPDIAGYKLPQYLTRPFADEVAQLQQSTLVLNRMQQEERVSGVVDRAVGQLLTGDLVYRVRRHLEDTALYFARTEKRVQAGWAVAAAARIRDGAELKRVGFFQLFVRAQLGAILTEQQQKQQEQPRLIMTPAEMMRARAQAQTRTQRGRAR
jgi:hypothetical protein